LRWPDDKIRREAEIRVSNAVKEREYRDTIEDQRDNLAMMLRRALGQMRKYEMDVDDLPTHGHRKFMEQAEELLDRYGLKGDLLR